MRRREFITLVAAATTTFPIAARAQRLAGPLIGFLSSRSPEEAAGHTSAFLQGLRGFGYVDGQSATIEYRWARGQYDRLPALAAELAGLKPAVIVAAGGTPSARAAKVATSSVPIIFVTSDAVSDGLVASLSRPGGNATGVDIMSGTLGGKRLELLTQMVPKAEIFGFLANTEGNVSAPHIQDVQAAAHNLNRRLVVVSATAGTDLEKSFSTLAESGVAGLVVENDPSFDARRSQLIALAAHHRIPAIYHIREFPVDGGLMSYGSSLVDGYYQAGVQTGRVLKGANVADLPVVRLTRFELVINLRAAGSLGLTPSPTFFAQADEVIE